MSDNDFMPPGLEVDVSPTRRNGEEPEHSTGGREKSSPLDELTELFHQEMTENDDDAQGHDDGGRREAGEEDGQGFDEASDDLRGLQTDDATAQGGDGEEEVPDKLSELVKKLGTTHKNVYDNMKVPIGGDGREVTLGELKDRYQERDALFADVVEGREAMAAERSEMVRERQAVEALLPYATEVPQEVKDQVRDHYEATVSRETNLFQKALPELKGQVAFDEFRTELADHLARFGFHPSELTITDHRLLLAIHDAMSDKKFIAKLKSLKPAQKKPARKAVKQATKPPERAANGQYVSQSRQIDQVVRLLGS